MSSSDLLEHFKLNAKVFPDYTLHTSTKSDRTRDRRKEKVETKWYRKTSIGHGSFGEVWLETESQKEGTANQRAVKILNKRWMRAYEIDYSRELTALAKFSKSQV
jgi:hypothetical protein